MFSWASLWTRRNATPSVSVVCMSPMSHCCRLCFSPQWAVYEWIAAWLHYLPWLWLMNNVFGLGGVGGWCQLSVEQSKLYFMALDCVVGRRIIKGRLCFGEVESHRPLPWLLGSTLSGAPPDEFYKASSDAKHRFTYWSHRSRKIPPQLDFIIAIPVLV